MAIRYSHFPNCRGEGGKGVKLRFSDFFLPISINNDLPPPIYEFFIKSQPPPILLQATTLHTIGKNNK